MSRYIELMAKAVRRRKSALLSGMLHLITACGFVTVFIALHHSLPPNTPLADLESSVQLLAQILAMVVGVLLLGTTVILSSYDGAETLNAIQNDLRKATDKFFAKFFAGGRRAHKLDLKHFRNFALSRPRIETLQFFKPSAPKEDSWFIYRPYWDGVWYQVANSPFASSSKSPVKLFQVQTLHEATICAYTVLQAVSEFRKSGSALLTTENGTNGSRWFIENFCKYLTTNGLEVPDKTKIDQAKVVIALAIESDHYMREELSVHTDNVNWIPHVLTTFQLRFSDYATSLLHLVQKLQLLRLANAAERFPQSIESINDKAHKVTSFKLLGKARREIAEIRARAVTAHGTTSYFDSIKRMSIFGIGTALIVLIVLLVGWPFLKLAAVPEIRLFGFAALYSAGIAALIESSWFLGRLLWKRRQAG